MDKDTLREDLVDAIFVNVTDHFVSLEAGAFDFEQLTDDETEEEYLNSIFEECKKHVNVVIRYF